MGIPRHLTRALYVVAPAVVGIGAYYKSGITPYLAIAITVLAIVLVALRRTAKNDYPWLLYSLSLALMYQASMYGAHIVGSDVHGEYYVSRMVELWGWHPFTIDYGTQSSTSYVVGWIVPFLTKFGLSTAMVYKAILPAIFAATPVVLYLAFRKQFGSKTAFYAAVFFMIVPVTTLEIVQIGKSMVAELFFALTILALVSSWRYRIKLPLMLAFSIGALFAHYTIGLALIAYLAGIFLIRVGFGWTHYLSHKTTPAMITLFALVLSMVAGFAYYRSADGGSIMTVVNRLAPSYTKSAIAAAQGINAPPTSPGSDSVTAPASVNEPQSYADKWNKNELLMKTAVGFDFPQASVPGKAFRIVQYLTQALILIGGLALLFRRKRYHISADFMAGIAASYVLLLLCVAVPQFSSIINATRFYHISLFFLAPVFVLGAKATFQREYALVATMLVYFVFTSGLVFEITKSERINEIDTPYSVGLSAERTGIVATFTSDDIKAAEWLAANAKPNYLIVGDYNGWHLASGYLGLDWLRRDRDPFKPYTLANLPTKPAYIIITSWNTKHGRYIDSLQHVYGGAGLREAKPLPSFYFPVIFRSGDAIVYEKTY